MARSDLVNLPAPAGVHIPLAKVESLIKRVALRLRQELTGVAPPGGDYAYFAEQRLDIQRAEEQLNVIESFTGIKVGGGQRVLEVGSGFGAFLAVVATRGAWVAGIEVSAEDTVIAHDLLTICRINGAHIIRGVGEHLPFPNDSFDLVYSTNVLEHVSDPEQVLCESIRILKPGGVLQFVIPNYGSWWEGHYNLFWIPRLPKRLAKLYVRLFFRNPAYLDTLHLINYRLLENWLKRHHERIKVLDWGAEVWKNRMRSTTLPLWGCLGHVDLIVRLLHHLKITEWVVRMGQRWHWETPLILSLKKIA